MCVCISVYHCTSDYFWSRHFSFSQFKCSSVNHGAFTKQGRAAATWQSCKEKLLKVNCSTEEAVNTAVQRLSHQPPPSHSKVPRAPHLEVSAQSLSLQNNALLTGISAPEIPTWPGDGEVISFPPFLAQAAWQCWILELKWCFPKEGSCSLATTLNLSATSDCTDCFEYPEVQCNAIMSHPSLLPLLISCWVNIQQPYSGISAACV